MICTLLLHLIFQQAPSSAPPALPAPDKVVIKVNDHAITAHDLEPYVWDWASYAVGQELINYEMIRQAAEKRGIKIADADVEQAVSNELQRDQTQFPKGMPVQEAMRRSGRTRSRLALQIRSSLLLQKMVMLDFDQAKFVRVSTIVIRPKTQSAADVQTALTAAKTAYDALQRGMDWDKAIQQYATDQQAQLQHGEIGWVQIADFPEVTRPELPSLKLMSYTNPVITSNGIQIFRLEARGKDATPGELSQLKATYQQRAAKPLLDKLRADAKIETAY
jgi:hypothetical protein